MTVGSVGASSAAMDNRPAGPPDITKSGLEQMRDRITKAGGEAPAGLDTLIAKFDEAAGSSGKMTFQAFKSFAAENGVTLPEPGKGKEPGGMRLPGGTPPAGGGKPAQASGGAGKSASSSSSTSDDVSALSDAQLQAKAAKGDTKAIKEMEKREAAKAQLQGRDTTKFPKAFTDPDDVGNAVDVYA